MKQETFDNTIKVANLIAVGYFLFLLTRFTQPTESNDGGRYRFINKSNGYILDSKTGYLYDYDDRIKR